MPTKRDAGGAGIRTTTRARSRSTRRLNNQPAIRVDYAPTQSLRTTLKYAGEMQRQQRFPGTIPGYNDTMVPHPVITTFSGTANYTLTPTTFLEGTYGITQNEVAGCTTLNGICRAAIYMNDAANKNLVGLRDLPVIFPEGLAVDPRYYQLQGAEQDAAGLLAGRPDLLAAELLVG